MNGGTGFIARSERGIATGAQPANLPERDSFGGVGTASAAQLVQTPGVEAMPALHLLVVDEDESVRTACAEIAAKMGFVVTSAADPGSARAILKHEKMDLLLLDLKSPSAGGLALLEEVKGLQPETNVIVMTAFATVTSAVEAMRIGADEYLTKPFALEELVERLGRAGERRHFDLESRRIREKLRNQKGRGHLVGQSPEMEKLYRIVSKAANASHAVLILGETGTGKELVARSIHFNGPHAQRPFVPVDCGSMLPELIESELFGYVKGAFPGLSRSAPMIARDGLLASAEGGTVFLDEIGELPLDLQAKLLRALQERAVRPVGGTHSVPISARVLAATNRDLAAMVNQGRFRKDLYLSLNIVNLRIPPLRDRREDIPLLAQHFLDRIQREKGIAHTFSDDALRAMMAYDWPGNARELENAVERACALSSGPVLHMGDLPTQLHAFRRNSWVEPVEGEAQVAQEAAPEGGIVSIAEMEKLAILGTIRQLRGDKLMAAKLLGIGKTTLYRKLKEYGITEETE